MIKELLIIFFLLPLCGWTQITFTSPYTQHFPSSQIEGINRSVFFYDSTIIIATETEEGKDIQTLLIGRIEEEEGNIVYHCTSKDARYPTKVVVPERENVEIIDIYEPSLTPGEENHFRLLID